jgi:hypothetical protein
VGSLPKAGTARRAFPNFRREAPFPEQGRLQPMRFATPAWQAAAKAGRLRRGIPTNFEGRCRADLAYGAPPLFQTRRRQPSRRAVARKPIADGPKGAASGARARQRVALQLLYPPPPLTRSLPLARPSGQPTVALSPACPGTRLCPRL